MLQICIKNASSDYGQVCLWKWNEEMDKAWININASAFKGTDSFKFLCKFVNLLYNIPHNALLLCFWDQKKLITHDLWPLMLPTVDHFWSHANTPPPIISLLGMDPPKEMAVSDVTEDAVTISWIKPLAPFEYYKLSYQSARGSIFFTYCNICLHCIIIMWYLLSEHICQLTAF